MGIMKTEKNQQSTIDKDTTLETINWMLDERKNFKDRRQDKESSVPYEQGLKKDRRVNRTDRRARDQDI